MAEEELEEVQSHEFNDEHEAFAASRSSDYVYVPSSGKYFKKLDQHVDSIEVDIKLPLVVLGENGIGKSALLANWMQRRRLTKHRDDFLFQHFVSCSTASCKLANMISRLETALKSHFQLREMEVPRSEERLRWSLTRYLSAAAKKAYPAHLIVVIDGVNFLKAEGSPDGSLHWLPTELPSNVRFIISTIVQPSADSDDDGDKPEVSHNNRSYTELRRRNCPEMRMEPLGITVRHKIIDEFIKKLKDKPITLNEKQHFKMGTSRPTSQPLFLRMLLYALQLTVEMSDISIDEQLDKYLASENESPMDLISQVLDFCSDQVDRVSIKSGSKSLKPGILGRVLSAVYSARNGLSDDEIWGIVELSMGHVLTPEHKKMFLHILKDITMTVKGLRTFSHEAYRKVVYAKYIRTPERHIKQHQLMARYFGRLEPCSRKINSLTYHLEVSGNWSKLKQTLVEVNMFRIWWTPQHKSEFIDLWASLTSIENENLKLVTGEFDEKTMRCNQTKRPSYDMVEEYTHSIDVYKTQKHPSDEKIGDVILMVGDFLLEFAILGHERNADVPQFIHPSVPNDDLKVIGVPHITQDESGRAKLNVPKLRKQDFSTDDDKGQNAGFIDFTPKPNEDFPTISTYYYQRWMWIQFPYIAVANCDRRFMKGVKGMIYFMDEREKDKTLKLLPKDVLHKVKPEEKIVRNPLFDKPRDLTSVLKKPDVIKALAPVRVPSLLHKIRKATRPDKVIPNKYNPENRKGYNNSEKHKSMREMMKDLRLDINEYRQKHDFLVQQRVLMEAGARALYDEHLDLVAIETGTQNKEKELTAVKEIEAKTSAALEKTQLINKNYYGVVSMCRRHPAEHPALIAELEKKLAQDIELIAKIRERLWEEIFENQAYEVDYPTMRNAIQETMMLRHEMLMSKDRQRENLKNAHEETLRMMNRGAQLSSASVQHAKKGKNRNNNTNCHEELDKTSIDQELQKKYEKWNTFLVQLSAKTGINDIDLFFQKFNNCDVLEEQMREMRKSADKKQHELKSEFERLEKELEEIHNFSDAGATNSSIKRTSQEGSKEKGEDDAESLEQQMRKAYLEFKRSRERSNTAESLEQRARAGLKHISEILGIPSPDQDTPVHETVHQIESVLDILQEEKEKNQQSNDVLRSPVRDSQIETSQSVRPHELEMALQSFELPKNRVPFRLIHKPLPEDDIFWPPEKDGDDLLEEGVFDRDDIKYISQKTEKAAARRQAKASKNAPPAAV